MDRRQFLVVSGGGLGIVGLGGISGCKAVRIGRAEGSLDVAHRAGAEHLVFHDGDDSCVLDPHSHTLTSLDGGQRVGTVEAGFIPGNDDGDLNFPLDAQRGADGRLYVLEHGNHRIQVFDADHRPVGVIGEFDLMFPQDLQVVDDRIYVCDTLAHRVLVFDLDGATLFGFGELDPFGDGDGLNGPVSITVDGAGRLHVLELGSCEVQIFDRDGQQLGRYAGLGLEPQLVRPRSIVSLGDGRLCVADPSSGQIHVFNEEGDHLGAFAPTDENGEPVVPVRLSIMPDGGLYIWTSGLTSADA